MPKELYCSQCGKELVHKPIAVPSINRILHVVEPHECEDVQPLPEGSPINLTPLPKADKRRFPTGKFVQKINELEEIKDIRPKEVVREEKEVKSSAAPNGVFDFLENLKKG